MIRVLFLDIDGVMNSSQTARATGGYDTLASEALGYIQALSQAGVLIVVSSSWRYSHSKQALSEKLGVPVHDTTPLHGGSRGQEIQAWLDEHKPDLYAIIDDDSDILPSQGPYFVHTRFTLGMQPEHYWHIRALLQIPVNQGLFS